MHWLCMSFDQWLNDSTPYNSSVMGKRGSQFWSVKRSRICNGILAGSFFYLLIPVTRDNFMPISVAIKRVKLKVRLDS